ncbi:DUF58 domain-containing protein [Clostridium neuense]|uniref:DUF58 domain-containing protein n=1 Tax=Clostridium neuense TaxID=1728934 RepID=A0ABW8TGB0_9CLOT
MEIIWVLVLVCILIIYEVKLYTKYCFRNLDFKLELSKSEVFENESVILKEIISNKKFLPALWLEIQFLVSRNLKFDNMKVASLDNEFYKKDSFSILPYQKVVRSLNVKALKRGYYSLNNFTLTISDIFILYKYLLHTDDEKFLYVYPKLLLGINFDLKFHSIIGELETKKHLLYDPFMLKGIRDYTPYDSMKTVNWSASVRTGTLKVNEFNSSSSMEIIILLDTTKYISWESETEIEESIRIAASMAAKCAYKNIPVSLYSNGINDLSQKPISISYKNGKAGLDLIYKNLACINLENQKLSFSNMLKDFKVEENTNSLCIVISHHYSEAFINELMTLKKFNVDVDLILVKESPVTNPLSSKIKTYVWEVTNSDEYNR